MKELNNCISFHDKALALELVRRHFEFLIYAEESKIVCHEREEDVKMVESRIKRYRADCTEWSKRIMSHDFERLNFILDVHLK